MRADQISEGFGPVGTNGPSVADRAGAEPAYPWGEHGTVLGGLTKREAFAMAAMQGILANPFYAQEAQSCETSGSFATAAVYHADALLLALNQEPRT